MRTGSLKVALIHPTLGIGGAERLMLDAGRALVERGHRVTFMTGTYDPDRSLWGPDEGGMDLEVWGRQIPEHLGDRVRLPLAVGRLSYVAWRGRLRARGFQAVLTDLVPQALPILRHLARAPVAYYGHFPDTYLAPPGGWAYGLYRRGARRLEARGLEAADAIAVNSRFTAQAYRRAFPALGEGDLQVIYPAVDLPDTWDSAQGTDPVVLSLGRFDPQKNHALALRAFAHGLDRLGRDRTEARLVIAGGYDPGLRENARTFAALSALISELGLGSRVTLLRSIPDRERDRWLRTCRCVIYPPLAEHFGLVPLEAMGVGRPVVAVAHGGPLETVVDGETGFLCPPSPKGLGDRLASLLADPALAGGLGAAARRHVERAFGPGQFSRSLGEWVEGTAARG